MRIGTRIFLDKLKENTKYCCSQFHVLEIQDFVFPENLVYKVDALYKEYETLLNGFQGEITIHGPYMDLNPISMDTRVRELTLERYLQAVEIAKVFDSRWIVIHTYFSQIHNQESWYQDYWIEENLKFWEKVIPVLEKEKKTIVLENVFDVNPSTIKELVDGLGSEFFKACLDVGHCNVFSEESIKTWLEVLGERLRYLHLSDNNGKRDNHLPIGSGSIDFQEIVNNLPKNRKDLIVISEAFCSPEEEIAGFNVLIS
ncbi:MAG: sugar phosphate isomerase/epimerase [Clostridia bacterium]|nr:sugar phosphate isomerase/epimerase [Clostridia bacterium]